jgi:hypothetical protein
VERRTGAPPHAEQDEEDHDAPTRQARDCNRSLLVGQVSEPFAARTLSDDHRSPAVLRMPSSSPAIKDNRRPLCDGPRQRPTNHNQGITPRSAFLAWWHPLRRVSPSQVNPPTRKRPSHKLTGIGRFLQLYSQKQPPPGSGTQRNFRVPILATLQPRAACLTIS